MSNFRGRNGLTSIRDLMIERERYKKLAFPDRGGLGPKNVLDFNFAERNLYGKIDTNGNAVIPIPNKLAPLYSELNYQSTMAVQNFLAQAFQNLSNHMERACTLRIINTDSPYLSRLEPVRAYSSPTKEYNEYMSLLLADFGSSYLATSPVLRKITSFKDYCGSLIDYSRRAGQNWPLTFTGWHRSKRSSIFTSGMAIDISGLSMDDDKDKQNLFLRDPNFDYYVNLCRYYGLVVSKNAPWVIAADISSPAMRPNLEANNMGSIESVFARNFVPSRIYDIELLKEAALQGFNSFVRQFPYDKEIRVCKSGKTRYNIIQRQLTNINLVNQNNDYRVFNNLYVELRNIEEREPFKKSDLARIKKNANYFHKALGPDRGFEFINEQFRSLYKFKEGGAISIRRRLARKRQLKGLQGKVDKKY